MRRKKPKEIGEVLKQFVRKNHLEKGLEKQSISDSFLELCPQPLPKYIDKVEVRNHKLFVFIQAAAARQEMHYSKEVLLQKLNEGLSTDQKISEIVLL